MDRMNALLGKVVRTLDRAEFKLSHTPNAPDLSPMAAELKSLADEVTAMLTNWTEVHSEVPHNHT